MWVLWGVVLCFLAYYLDLTSLVALISANSKPKGLARLGV